MTKTVNSNDQVHHIFAQQTQVTGRTSSGNLWFVGDTLYSYATPICRVVHSSVGQRVALITSERYSPTTNGKHIPYSGLFEYAAFRVPSLGVGGRVGRHCEPADSVYGEVNHKANLAHFLKAYDDATETYLRRVGPYDRGNDYETGRPRILEWLEHRLNETHRYAETFGLAKPDRDPSADYAAIMACDAKRNGPEKVARREMEAAKRREKQAATDAAWAKDYRAAWRAGLPTPRVAYDQHLPRSPRQILCEDGGAMLRVKGETLETSQGAEVPLAHAIKLFRFIKAVRARGTRWQANGSTISVGHFQVDSIEANGDFKAGCHRLYWPEVARIAIVIGCYDDAASLEALDRRAA